MKYYLSALILGVSVASIAPKNLTAADMPTPVKITRIVPKIIALEDIIASEKNHYEIIGAPNLTLNSDLSTKEKLAEFWSKIDKSQVLVPFIVWENLPDFQEYSLSGNGTMLRGTFIISSDDDSSQFTIESGIKFLHTQLYVAKHAKVIFKGEFISSPYKLSPSNSDSYLDDLVEESYKRMISPISGGSIDLNEAILNPDNCVAIELLAGTVIFDNYSTTKNHSLFFAGSSSFDGNLSIGSDTTLRMMMDFLDSDSKLDVSGSLKFESNSSIEFIQSRDSHLGKENKLKSGMLIATATNITGDLSRVILKARIYDYDCDFSKENVCSMILKDMKLVSIKNGDNYDLILQCISREEKK